MNELVELEAWYASRCDGDWEHSYGVRIASLDNPGWTVEIDLAETELQERPFTEVHEREVGEAGWLLCRVRDYTFEAAGDTKQLRRLLRIFLDWAADGPTNVGPDAV